MVFLSLKPCHTGDVDGKFQILYIMASGMCNNH